MSGRAESNQLFGYEFGIKFHLEPIPVLCLFLLHAYSTRIWNGNHHKYLRTTARWWGLRDSQKSNFPGSSSVSALFPTLCSFIEISSRRWYSNDLMLLYGIIYLRGRQNRDFPNRASFREPTFSAQPSRRFRWIRRSESDDFFQQFLQAEKEEKGCRCRRCKREAELRKSAKAEERRLKRRKCCRKILNACYFS